MGHTEESRILLLFPLFYSSRNCSLSILLFGDDDENTYHGLHISFYIHVFSLPVLTFLFMSSVITVTFSLYVPPKTLNIFRLLFRFILRKFVCLSSFSSGVSRCLCICRCRRKDCIFFMTRGFRMRACVCVRVRERP